MGNGTFTYVSGDVKGDISSVWMQRKGERKNEKGKKKKEAFKYTRSITWGLTCVSSTGVVVRG